MNKKPVVIVSLPVFFIPIIDIKLFLLKHL